MALSRARCLAIGLLIGTANQGHAQSSSSMLPGLDLFMPPAARGVDNPALIALGRQLFFDPILSVDSSHSCGSCHQPAKGFTDGRARSVGVHGRHGTRNVPAIVNRGWGRAFFWDGRTTVLEDQVLRPISEPSEMGFSAAEAARRLGKHDRWRRQFVSVLASDADVGGLARALAAYVRSIRAGDSRFDRAMLGDAYALTAVEQRGLELFQGRARCSRCHSGALLTDEAFHNTGVAWRDGIPSDSGRAMVTGKAADVGSFKTPTLRQIGVTAPYMHDGSLGTLEEVIEFYDRGGNANPNRDVELRPLALSVAEKASLLAFLGTLDGLIVEGGRPATHQRHR